MTHDIKIRSRGNGKKIVVGRIFLFLTIMEWTRVSPSPLTVFLFRDTVSSVRAVDLSGYSPVALRIFKLAMACKHGYPLHPYGHLPSTLL